MKDRQGHKHNFCEKRDGIQGLRGIVSDRKQSMFLQQLNLDPNVVARGKKTVYVTRKIPEPGLKALRDAGCVVVTWDSDEAIPRETFVEKVKGVDGLLCMLTDNINAEILDAAGRSVCI